jgi:hypothetical protein
MHIKTEFYPKPAEGLITGSQLSGQTNAFPASEGLAVAPGAEQSAPAAIEITRVQNLARRAA